MLIVLEGCDGTGKSTLSNDLSRILKEYSTVTQLHRGVPIKHVLDEYELALYDYAPHNDTSIVCDRWHIGPDVYGPIKRNDNGLDPVIRWHINSFLLGKGALLVYTEMPIKPLIERMINRGEDYLHIDEVESVITLYAKAVDKSPLHKVLSLTGIHDTHKIIQSASSVATWASQSGSIKSYVGPRRPQELYVGNSSTPIAFMPYEGTQAYDIVSKYGLHNQNTSGFCNSTEDISRVWDRLYNPIIFALDAEAVESCKKYNVPYKRIEG